MFFRDIIGQQEVIERLVKDAQAGTVPHALLFTGPEGTGKLQTAIAFARSLLCRDKAGAADSCGQCPSCVKMDKLVHPDLHFVFPVINKSKSSDRSTVSDDEIKTVLENGCRLFFGTEFTKHSLFHNTEPLTLALPKGKGEDKILENNGGQAVYDDDDNNHLAKKDEFAETVKNDKISISNDSWNNFIPIFDIIRDILKR